MIYFLRHSNEHLTFNVKKIAFVPESEQGAAHWIARIYKMQFSEPYVVKQPRRFWFSKKVWHQDFLGYEHSTIISTDGRHWVYASAEVLPFTGELAEGRDLLNYVEYMKIKGQQEMEFRHENPPEFRQGSVYSDYLFTSQWTTVKIINKFTS